MGTGVQLLRPTKNKETYITLKLNKLANTPSSNVEILLLLKSLQERRMGQSVMTGSSSCLPRVTLSVTGTSSRKGYSQLYQC